MGDTGRRGGIVEEERSQDGIEVTPGLGMVLGLKQTWLQHS